MTNRETKRGEIIPLNALRYGPFGYVASAVVGFVVGNGLFLAGDAIVNETPGANPSLEAPLLLAFAGVTALIFLILAIFGNYLVGRAIRKELELQRQEFSGKVIPPPPFDDLGEKARWASDLSAPITRSPQLNISRAEASDAKVVRTDTNAVSNVHVEPEFGGAIVDMGEDHEHELSRTARR